jgi:hypothetical protein
MSYKLSKIIFPVGFALSVLSCAALQPPSATGPRANEPPYPVLFKEDFQRKDAATTEVKRLLAQTGTSEGVDLKLQPVTSTVSGLTTTNSPLRLPRVGTQAVMNEEETRESLRRFIRDWQQLIGSDPAKLSLVERTDLPDGTKLALYEQRPFRYPIRGNYGKLEIRFSTDRRVLNLMSSCIPDADRIQTALAASTVRLKAEDVVKQLNGGEVTYTDAKANKISIKQPQVKEGNPRGLVTYVMPSKNQPDALEFHLSWEVELTNAPIKTAYVDAVSGEIIATE